MKKSAILTSEKTGDPNMAQTWTDTTYKLDGTEMTILTTHEGFNQVSLYVPGYSLDGRGFSIYFGIDHIELLEEMLGKLKQLARTRNGVNVYSNPDLTETELSVNVPSPALSYQS